MPRQLEEITATFLRERFRRDDFVIGEARVVNGRPQDGATGASPSFYAGLSVKGTAEPGELEPGLEYRFYGRRETHPKYGESFAFKTFVLSQPHERRGVIAYLQKCPHIGPSTARKLWEKFGGQAVRVLRESPDVAAAAVPGNRFTEAHATEAAEVLHNMAATEDATIDLISLLAGRGFPKNTAKEAIKAWGNRAAKLIERNPYLLVFGRFRGCGFLRTDAMYLDLGLPPGKMKRQALCAWHALASDTDGHTWHPVQTVITALRQKIAGAEVQPVRACRLAKRAGMIAVRGGEDGTVWLAERKKAQAEERVAVAIAEAAGEAIHWPNTDAIAGPTDHQRTHLALALAGPIGILGGAPGTGKTFTAAALVKEITRTCGLSSVAICAPTSLAAVRIGATMQGYGLDVGASTIHRLLEVESLDGGVWAFRHHENNPLPYQFIIVDESSMIDTGLMASLLAARGKGTHILFVGDINQLPPVGHGAPLRDMIAAGVPYGELREIRRNAGTVVKVCSRIRDNQRWVTDQAIIPDDPDDPKNLVLIPARDGKAAVDRIVELIQRIRAAGLVDPVWGVQVIVAVNKRSELSRKILNQRLQAELNPGERVGDSPFRLHDKVIHLKPAMLPAAKEGDGDDEGKFLIANGDMGRVVEVQPKLTVVQFQNPDRLVKVPRGSAKEEGSGDDDDSTGTGCDLDLAYAVTGHKSQGNEWPVVIVALDEHPGARRVCSREWLYTSISRLQKVCFLVGKLSTAHAMCRRVALTRRKTFLRELIEEKRKEIEQDA